MIKFIKNLFRKNKQTIKRNVYGGYLFSSDPLDSFLDPMVDDLYLNRENNESLNSDPIAHNTYNSYTTHAPIAEVNSGFSAPWGDSGSSHSSYSDSGGSSDCGSGGGDCGCGGGD